MAENTNLNLTVEAWADIVIERWETKIARLKIGHTGQLVKSFEHHVHTQANGIPELIIFAFEYYGKFVDMGVGRGVTVEDVSFSSRRPKPWYSKVFYSQLEKLKEILVEKYENKAQIAVLTNVKWDGKKSSGSKKTSFAERIREEGYSVRDYKRVRFK